MGKWDSEAQRRWGNSKVGIEQLGQAEVNRRNKASEGHRLPERVGPSRDKSHWSHPGQRKHYGA